MLAHVFYAEFQHVCRHSFSWRSTIYSYNLLASDLYMLQLQVSLFYKWWYLKRKKWNIHKCLRAPPSGGPMRTLVLWRGGRKLQREWRVVMKLNRWMNRWKFHSIPFFTYQRPIWPFIWSYICGYMELYGTLQLLGRIE